MPVDDLLRRVKHGEGALFGDVARGGATFPIHQRSSTTDDDNFVRDILGVSAQRRAEHVGILDQRRQGATDTGGFFRKFERRIMAEDQTNVAIRRAG